MRSRLPRTFNQRPSVFSLLLISPGNQLEFGFSLLVYQAAVEGLGVAVAQPEFVQDDLAAGRLVAPFPMVFPTGRQYFLICSPSRARAEPIASFLKWTASEGHST